MLYSARPTNSTSRTPRVEREVVKQTRQKLGQGSPEGGAGAASQAHYDRGEEPFYNYRKRGYRFAVSVRCSGRKTSRVLNVSVGPRASIRRARSREAQSAVETDVEGPPAVDRYRGRHTRHREWNSLTVGRSRQRRSPLRRILRSRAYLSDLVARERRDISQTRRDWFVLGIESFAHPKKSRSGINRLRSAVLLENRASFFPKERPARQSIRPASSIVYAALGATHTA